MFQFKDIFTECGNAAVFSRQWGQETICKRNLNHCDFQHVCLIFEVSEYQSIPEVANQLSQKED